jgi:hypothetical protein
MKQKFLLEKLSKIENPWPTWQNGGGKRYKLIKSEMLKGYKHK